MLPGVFAERYEEDMAIVRTKTQWCVLALAVVFLFTIPLYSSDTWLSRLIFLFIWIIAVLGLHILTGLCGLFSMAQAAFMGVGAYISAILVMRYGWSPWFTLPVAGLGAGALGLIMGVPSLRIKGFYFAVATLAAAFIITWMLGYFDGWTGGDWGMAVDTPSIGGLSFKSKGNYFYIAAILMVLAIVATKNIQRTKTGRAFIAIRDNELAAQVMGVNLFRYKSLALFLACFLAGIAGWLWAHDVRHIHPGQFGLMDAIWMIGILMIGGVGSTTGAIAGTVLLKGLDVAIVYLVPVLTDAWPSMGISIAASLRPLLFSLAIIIIMMLQPKGLYSLWGNLKVSYRLYPYSY